MRALIFCLALLPAFWTTGAVAQTASLDNRECAGILERWANDPKSVPKRLVDQCKDQLAAVAPAAAPEEPMAAAIDPCAGPNAGASVLCWGPWAGLEPSAAAPVPGAPDTNPVTGLEPRPETAEIFQPEVEPDEVITPEPPFPPLPLGPCTPGAPCGFATLVDGRTSSADPADTSFHRFDLAPDGSQFTVDPGGEGEINSVTGMDTTYGSRPDEYENLVATGRSGDEQSRIGARVIRSDDGEGGPGDIEVAADIWTHGNRATGKIQSGYFAWGNATSQAGLDSLRGQGASVRFSGPMSVDNATVGSMTLNFGTQPAWSGNWVNPGYSFSAGGRMSGVDLVSDSDKFSANVLADSVVQGALLGEPGSQSIAHIIDVNLADKGRIKDVGLLREAGVAPAPGISNVPQ